MTSRRVPVPNPKFARSSSDDEKDDDDDTKRAAKSSSNFVGPTLTKGVSKQQVKIKDTNSKRASKKTSSSVDEALVVVTTTTKKNGPSGKKLSLIHISEPTRRS